MTEARDQDGETAPAAGEPRVLWYPPDGSDPLPLPGGGPAYVVAGDGPLGVGDEVQVAALAGAGRPVAWEVGTVTEVDGDRGEQPAAAAWDCQAYGPEGTKHGALCFFSPELGERDCRTAGQCAERMTGERRRVYGRISEMAAAGDPVGAFLAEEFGSPDDLLGGFGGREPVSLVEAVKRATTDPGYGVARLECAPDVVGYLHQVAAKEEPAPPWQPAPIRPLQAVSVVVDADMPAGWWRMVTAGGDVVWEGTVGEEPGPAPER